MKRAVVGIMLVVGCGAWSTAAFAEDTIAPAKAAVLNNPPQAIETVKKVVNILDPSYETLWLWSGGTFSQGVSASLWNFASNDIHLASLRMGFGTNDNLYGGVGIDVPGLCRRFIPAQIKGIATTKPLDALWTVAGKYARVTPIGGYSWGEDKPIYGVAVGAAVNF